ncbi:uncharacterized protein LOC114730082 [Neltuma alba]|uniref:uncharacterized protein LOC114730082 n=1 Tax=Neltuma alba TaxID=207710 RepID=UPI0010A36FCD|nr:uncharacterized protein LOC114730082 [Prosopis alba]
MEEYYYRRSQVPAFGSWDWNDNLPFTQCFESATQAGFFRCAFSDHSDDQDRDLYVTGDLYQNDVVTPAMIVVPRKRKTKVRGKGGAAAEEDREKEEQKYYWESEHEGGRSPIYVNNNNVSRPTPKPVDEDLYTISPELLYQKHTKKRGLSFFSSCLLPTCIA